MRTRVSFWRIEIRGRDVQKKQSARAGSKCPSGGSIAAPLVKEQEENWMDAGG